MKNLIDALSVSINRFVFTPRPSTDVFDFHYSNPKAELCFLPILEHGCRYEIPLLWVKLYDSLTITTKKSEEDEEEEINNKSGDRQLEKVVVKSITMLYLHGTSATIGHHVDEMISIGERMQKQAAKEQKNLVLDIDIVLVEYPGYSLASPLLSRNPKTTMSYALANGEGEILLHPTSERLRMVGKHVMETVFDCSGNNSGQENKKRDLIVIGRSMGTGLALELAANYHERIDSVILLAPYTAIERVIYEALSSHGGQSVTDYFLFPMLKGLLKLSNTRFFSSLENIGQNIGDEVSILLFHGLKDALISHHHSEDLLKARKEKLDKSALKKENQGIVKTFFDPEGNHGQLEYHDALISYLVKEKICNKKANFGAFEGESKFIKLRENHQELSKKLMIPSSKTERDMRNRRFQKEVQTAAEIKANTLFYLRMFALALVAGFVVVFTLCLKWYLFTD